MVGFYVPGQPDDAPAPKVVRYNHALAKQLAAPLGALDEAEAARFFSGKAALPGSVPLAQAYAGHQFGHFSPQLGDGRALLLGEVVGVDGIRRDIQLKGSGRTPFSRGGDGKAAIGPVLREYIMSEAMHALGVPTTRALAAVTTGEQIEREGAKPGAVLTRVASSHLRVGTFQFFAARGETDKVRQLADYTIARHFPDLAQDDNPYLALLTAVADGQAALVARWMSLGFVHGVMNTDNTGIAGETIDYGPCAFIDSYHPQAVFSSIDRGARYAFAQQPMIARWNMARFAETLLPLIDPDNEDRAIADATAAIEGFAERYTAHYARIMRTKLGLVSQEPEDAQLFGDLLAALEGQNADYTGVMRALSDAAMGDDEPAATLLDDDTQLRKWLHAWRERLARDPQDARARQDAMNRANPIYIPRNHLVEQAVQDAQGADYTAFHKLVDVLADPFTQRAGLEEYARPAPPDFGPYKTFCGT